ncbi:fructosamine/ketosamine-3-kinase [Apiospora hydei]|uniref:protein-ribulosamine 3-kinase n=1 Tax=Apiospora hydei TaxID=1337664 RepID=A0ABR1X881_9PEZI
MGPTDKAVWDQEIPVPQSTISGASYWARTAKLEALDKDGNEDSYSVKVHQGDHGKTMVSAECEAMKALYKLIPEMVARPIAWESFQDIPDTHFFVCKYHEMSEDIPDITDFPALVAEFHKRSASPDGKFGDTWEDCFRKGMEGIFAAELETHGPDKEWERLTKLTLEKTIPRLLGALEADGRKIVPRLVHGDLWEGNCSVDVNTGAPMIFDATPLYAHNEYELGPWLCPRHRFPPYIDEYTKHFPVSAPTEEFGDRIELYYLRFDAHSSSLYPGNLRFRSIAQETMRRLVEKYQLDEGSKPEGDSVPDL